MAAVTTAVVAIAVTVTLMSLSFSSPPEWLAVHSARPSFAYCQFHVHLVPQKAFEPDLGQLATEPPPIALMLVFCCLAFAE